MPDPKKPLLLRDYLAQQDGATQPVAEAQPEEKVGPHPYLAALSRGLGGIGSGILASEPGLGTAAGAGLAGISEKVAEMINDEPNDPAAIAASTALGMVPMGAVFKQLRAGKLAVPIAANALRGAGFAQGGTSLNRLLHGQSPLPQASDIPGDVIGAAPAAFPLLGPVRRAIMGSVPAAESAAGAVSNAGGKLVKNTDWLKTGELHASPADIVADVNPTIKTGLRVAPNMPTPQGPVLPSGLLASDATPRAATVERNALAPGIANKQTAIANTPVGLNIPPDQLDPAGVARTRPAQLKSLSDSVNQATKIADVALGANRAEGRALSAIEKETQAKTSKEAAEALRVQKIAAAKKAQEDFLAQATPGPKRLTITTGGVPVEGGQRTMTQTFTIPEPEGEAGGEAVPQEKPTIPEGQTIPSMDADKASGQRYGTKQRALEAIAGSGKRGTPVYIPDGGKTKWGVVFEDALTPKAGAPVTGPIPVPPTVPEGPVDPREATETAFVRHGETDLNGGKSSAEVIRGWKDVPLNDAGKAQAADAGNTLARLDKLHPFDKIYTSDLGRAQETAQIMKDKLGRDVPIQVMPELRPWNVGDLSGTPTTEALPIMQHLIDNPDKPAPNGESFNDYLKRYLPVAKQIHEENSHNILVGHTRTAAALDGLAQNTGETPIPTDIFKTKHPLEPGGVMFVGKDWQTRFGKTPTASLEKVAPGLPSTLEGNLTQSLSRVQPDLTPSGTPPALTAGQEPLGKPPAPPKPPKGTPKGTPPPNAPAAATAAVEQAVGVKPPEPPPAAPTVAARPPVTPPKGPATTAIAQAPEGTPVTDPKLLAQTAQEMKDRNSWSVRDLKEASADPSRGPQMQALAKAELASRGVGKKGAIPAVQTGESAATQNAVKGVQEAAGGPVATENTPVAGPAPTSPVAPAKPVPEAPLQQTGKPLPSETLASLMKTYEPLMAADAAYGPAKDMESAGVEGGKAARQAAGKALGEARSAHAANIAALAAAGHEIPPEMLATASAPKAVAGPARPVGRPKKVVAEAPAPAAPVVAAPAAGTKEILAYERIGGDVVPKVQKQMEDMGYTNVRVVPNGDGTNKVYGTTPVKGAAIAPTPEPTAPTPAATKTKKGAAPITAAIGTANNSLDKMVSQQALPANAVRLDLSNAKSGADIQKALLDKLQEYKATVDEAGPSYQMVNGGKQVDPRAAIKPITISVPGGPTYTIKPDQVDNAIQQFSSKEAGSAFKGIVDKPGKMGPSKAEGANWGSVEKPIVAPAGQTLPKVTPDITENPNVVGPTAAKEGINPRNSLQVKETTADQVPSSFRNLRLLADENGNATLLVSDDPNALAKVPEDIRPKQKAHMTGVLPQGKGVEDIIPTLAEKQKLDPAKIKIATVSGGGKGPFTGNESGEMTPELAQQIAKHVAGAFVGSVMGAGVASDEHKKRDALIGAVAGALAPALMQKGAMDKLARWRALGLIANPVTLGVKALGDTGAILHEAAVGSIANKDPEYGKTLLKNFFSKDTLDKFKDSFNTPLESSSAADAYSQVPLSRTGPLSWAPRAMGAMTEATQDAAMRSGMSYDAAKDLTYLGTPKSKLGATIASIPGKGAAGRLVMPFARIATNLFEKGLENSPAGLVRLAGENITPEMKRRIIAEAALGTGVGALGYGASNMVDDKTTLGKAEKRLMQAAVGPAGLAMAIGDEARKSVDNSTKQNIGEMAGETFKGGLQNIANHMPLPPKPNVFEVLRTLAIPKAASDTAKLYDENVNGVAARKTNQDILDPFAADIPGMRGGLPEAKAKKQVTEMEKYIKALRAARKVQ